MNADDVKTATDVLSKIAAYDSTFPRPDHAVIMAWSEILDGQDRDDCLTAVADHYRTETRRIMPADVRAGVRRIRDYRWEHRSADEVLAEIDRRAEGWAS